MGYYYELFRQIDLSELEQWAKGLESVLKAVVAARKAPTRIEHSPKGESQSKGLQKMPHAK